MLIYIINIYNFNLILKLNINNIINIIIKIFAFIYKKLFKNYMILIFFLLLNILT